MPRKEPSSPPPAMTWRKAMPVLVLGGLFDLIRFMFVWIVFFAPAIGAAFCSVIVQSDSSILSALGYGTCALGATAVGIAVAPALMTFGMVMGLAIGFLGWLTVGFILLKTNARIFKENIVWFMGALVVGEIPLVDGVVPAITLVLAKMYRTQIRTEQAALRRYEKETEAAEKERQAALVRDMLRQRAEAEAANDAWYADAANDEAYAARAAA